MSFRHFYTPVVFLGLASMLAFNGCKSKTQPASSNQPANAPAAQSQQNPPQAGGATQAGAASGAVTSAASAAPQTPPPPPPPPVAVNLPVGTSLRVRLDEDLGSRINHPGDAFRATMADSVVINGRTVIARGARAEGSVVDAKALGHIKGEARLELRLERVHTKWGSYPVATSSIEHAEKGKGKRTAEFAGGGGAFGAIVGALAGGKKGALIGGLAGAGAGTAGSAMTGNQEIVLPAETLLTFRLEHSVHIVEQK